MKKAVTLRFVLKVMKILYYTKNKNFKKLCNIVGDFMSKKRSNKKVISKKATKVEKPDYFILVSKSGLPMAQYPENSCLLQADTTRKRVAPAS